VTESSGLEAVLDILIPTRGDLPGTLRLIREAKEAAGTKKIRILISVSDPKAWENFARVLSEFKFVHLLPKSERVPLYGNFRRLIEHSTAPWVSICADDDSIPRDFLALIERPQPETVKLLVPPIELRTYDRPSQSFGSEVLGIFNPRERLVDPVSLSGAIWPTWFFGIWRGDWIRRAFPEEDFDWLDCALVHHAIMINGVSWVEDASPMVCGFNPTRPPWTVSGGSLQTAGWAEYCSKFLAQSPFFTRFRWRWLVEGGIRRTARRLNRSFRG
jgi:hypothetical protein